MNKVTAGTAQATVGQKQKLTSKFLSALLHWCLGTMPSTRTSILEPRELFILVSVEICFLFVTAQFTVNTRK